MIIDLLLLVIQGALNVLLLPLTVINITVDFISSIPVFVSFLQVVAYLLPWGNLLPLIALTLSLTLLKIGITIVKTIWELIPIL